MWYSDGFSARLPKNAYVSRTSSNLITIHNVTKSNEGYYICADWKDYYSVLIHAEGLLTVRGKYTSVIRK